MFWNGTSANYCLMSHADYFHNAAKRHDSNKEVCVIFPVSAVLSGSLFFIEISSKRVVATVTMSHLTLSLFCHCRTQVSKARMLSGCKKKGKQNGQDLEEFSIEILLEEATLGVHCLVNLRMQHATK